MSKGHSSPRLAGALFVAASLVGTFALTGCAAPAPVVITIDNDDDSGVASDAPGGTGGSWLLRSEECLDVGTVDERSDWDLIDKNAAYSNVSTGCAYSNVEDTYAIGYYRITLGSASGGSDSVDVPELGDGALLLEQSALGGDDTGCIVFVPVMDEPDVFLGVTSNGGEEKPWREKCDDAVNLLDLLAEQQPKPEEVPESSGSAVGTNWIDCGPDGGVPTYAYRTEQGALTICEGWAGYFTDREYGSVSLYDIGGAGGNACGSSTDGREICTDMESFVYFDVDGEQVMREIVEIWQP